MTLVRRQPRSVYRVYTEEEYLAGVDLIADRDVSLVGGEGCGPAGREGRVRSLHRVAGAVALTGAVGTVGGLVGVAVLHAQTVEHPAIVARIERPTRRAAAGTGRSSRAPHARGVYTRPPPAWGARIETPHALPASHTRATGVDARSTSGVRVEAPPAPAAKAETRSVTTIDAVSVSRPAAAVNVETDSRAVREEAVSPPPRKSVQSEFGFER
jgi:hypothetical protein